MKNLTIALITLLFFSSFVNANVWKCPGAAEHFETKAEAEAVCGDKAFYAEKMGHMRHGGVMSHEPEPAPQPTEPTEPSAY